MKPVSVGIIGCGVIGRIHAKSAMESPQVKLVAVADLIEERAREVADQHSVPARYSEGLDLLDDPGVEAVVLALPANGRLALAMKAFRRGIHVLTEKPVAMNAGDVEQMIAARGALVAACCSSRYRLLPSAEVVTRFIATGALGELRVLHCRAISAAAEPPATPPPTWRLRRRENGGGILMNWGSYDLDYLLGVTGWSLVPRLVLGQTWTLAPHLTVRAAPDSDAETHVSALIRCEGGTVISYERAEFAAAQTENAWKIVGSRGALHLRMIAESAKRIAYDASSDAAGVSPQVLWEGAEDAAPLHAGPLRDFAAAIREGRPPKTTLEQALVVQKISDAIYASAEKGMAVAI